MVVRRAASVFRAEFRILPTPREHQRLDTVQTEVSQDCTRLSDGIRLGLLEILEISVWIQCLLFDGRFPERDIPRPSRRAIRVDNGE